MTRTTLAVLGAIGLAGLGAGGVALATVDRDSPTPPAQVSSLIDTPTTSASTSDAPRSSASTGNTGGGTLSRDDAAAIALARVGGGVVDQIEDEVEHGRAAWKVRIVKDGTRYDVYVDKANAEIFRLRDKGDD